MYEHADYLTAYVTIEQAERLLNTEYHAFQSQERLGRNINRCERYELPLAVDANVDFVAPTTNFPMHTGLRVHARAVGEVDTTPEIIRDIYGVGDDASTVASNKQQAAGFLQQYTSASDADSFFHQYSNTTSIDQLTIVGPNDGSNPGDEADLDVQYLMAIGNKVNTTYWYTDGQRPYDNEPFLVWLTNLTALPDDAIPHVISVSYGDNENTIEMAYAASVTTMLQALGARGVSVMFSSGDGYVHVMLMYGACSPEM
jgi:tripeptidyl-peptidase-1